LGDYPDPNKQNTGTKDKKMSNSTDTRSLPLYKAHTSGNLLRMLQFLQLGRKWYGYELYSVRKWD
jgi:hypothetical protein